MSRSMYRGKPESAPQKARKYNLWIRLYRNRWFTPDEFVWKFGERPDNIPHSAIELLNPIPFVQIGRDLVKQKVMEGKSAAEITLALDKLFAFEDKIKESEYKPNPFQEDSILWPDKEYPELPRLPEPDHPDYNDLCQERMELANEIAKEKAKELEEELQRRRDKFTGRHMRR